jgi:hypothetical protein
MKDKDIIAGDLDTLKMRLKNVERKIDILNAFELADYGASRADPNYDPYGDGAMDLFEKRIRAYEIANMLRRRIKELEGETIPNINIIS